MKNPDEKDDPRRRRLIQALSAGLTAAVLPVGQAQGFDIFGQRPARLADGQSIYRLSGRVTVNGLEATPSTRIAPGDSVETSDDGELIFVVNSNAMILRGGSQLTIDAGPGPQTILTPETKVISGLQLSKGRLLSVSRFNPMRIQTASAMIAIGGTGFYIEADPELTYFCTCYGSTRVTAKADPGNSETVESEHHDRPLTISATATDGKFIRAARFINHTDMELALIETLVGRTTPFAFPNDSYSAPRRRY